MELSFLKLNPCGTQDGHGGSTARVHVTKVGFTLITEMGGGFCCNVC